LPLQFRFPKRGLPFPSHVYYFSFPRSSLLFKFERDFNVIKNNNKNYKDTLRKYNFKKLREACTSEHVGLIFIFDIKEEREWDNLQEQQKGPSQQKEPTKEQILKKV
jgi:isochorismate hydrolase